MAINSISLEYRKKDTDELGESNPRKWILYRYLSVGQGEGDGGEIGILRRAFGQFYEFRIKIWVNEKVALMVYDFGLKDWKEI